MLRDCYDPLNLFESVPQLAREMDPVLCQLDPLLDDEPLFARVKADLAHRSPQTQTRGRPSTPVAVILRMLVVKRLYRFSYEETEQFVADSLVLRQFCRLYWERAPDDTTLIRWAHQIEPATLEQLNDRVVALARSLKVTRGRKLRVDSTVVPTNIHHPTDGSLLADGVRVLSRLLRRAKALLGDRPDLGKEAFRNRSRSVRELVRRLHRQARRVREAEKAPPPLKKAGKQPASSQDAMPPGKRRAATPAATPPAPGNPEARSGAGSSKAATAARTAMKQTYERLITLAEKSRAQAKKVGEALQDQGGKKAKRLVAVLTTFVPRVGQVIDQARRRVLGGEKVPAAEKSVSLFEPQTQIVKRGKPGHDVEFGRKVWLGEVEGGIVSGYRVLAEVGPDAHYLGESLTKHKEQFGRAPELLTGDRGVASPENEALAKAAGVKRVVLPASGKVPPERRAREKEGWFRRGYRFRAGIEGRTSVLKRRFGLNCCLEHGEAGMGRCVGWGILVSNLRQIAQVQAARQAS
jgi:IS5 family transposase